MVPDDDHDCTVIPAMRLQIPDEVAQGRVRIRNFAIVEAVLIGLRVGKRRLIRIMWIIEMYPDKLWSRRVRCEPLLSMRDHVHASPFHASPARFAVAVLRKVVVK